MPTAATTTATTATIQISVPDDSCFAASFPVVIALAAVLVVVCLLTSAERLAAERAATPAGG